MTNTPEEKEAFEFFEHESHFKDDLDRYTSMWEFRKETISIPFDDKQKAIEQENKIKVIKKSWKVSGFKVKTKTYGFSDLARCNVVVIVGIKHKPGVD